MSACGPETLLMFYVSPLTILQTSAHVSARTKLLSRTRHVSATSSTSTLVACVSFYLPLAISLSRSHTHTHTHSLSHSKTCSRVVRREEGLRLEARGAAGMTLRLVELRDALLALVVGVVVSVGVRVVACLPIC